MIRYALIVVTVFIHFLIFNSASNPQQEKFQIEKFKQYKTQLEQRTNLIIQGLQALGVKAVSLNDEQLTQLFYEFYNIED